MTKFEFENSKIENFSVITGKAKSRKSFFTSALLALRSQEGKYLDDIISTEMKVSKTDYILFDTGK